MDRTRMIFDHITGYHPVELELDGDGDYRFQDSRADGLLAAVAAVNAAIARTDTVAFDVRKYGAVGDGTTNDRAAIQATIDAAAAAGGGTVVFPKGTYKVQITTATTVTSPVGSGQHCLVIAGNNITLQGAPGAVIDCYVLNGDPDTNWEVVNGKVWRGGGVFVTGGATNATRRRNVQIQDLEIRGNFTYTGDHTFPANTTTGNGWDITHKGIWYANDLFHDDHSVNRCHIHGFAGEVLYCGGSDGGATPRLNRFAATNNLLHDSNGSIISLSGILCTIAGNEVHTAAGAGIEQVAWDGRERIIDNWVYDTSLDGINFRSFNQGLGRAEISGNIVDRPANAIGIGVSSAWYTQVHHNLLIDGGIHTSVLSGHNPTIRAVDITDNVILANAISFLHGILATNGVNKIDGLRIHRNRVGQTVAGVAGGFICEFPISGASVEWHKVDLQDNVLDGTHGDTSKIKAQNTLLTTTAVTIVASRKAEPDSMFLVHVSYQVITADTAVTVICQTNEPLNNGLITLTLQPLATKAPGVYTLPSFLVPANARATVVVKVTAGTANQVYASAVIREA